CTFPRTIRGTQRSPPGERAVSYLATRSFGGERRPSILAVDAPSLCALRAWHAPLDERHRRIIASRLARVDRAHHQERPTLSAVAALCRTALLHSTETARRSRGRIHIGVENPEIDARCSSRFPLYAQS